MPLLVVLALTAAVAPVPWPPSPFDLGPAASLALTAAAFLLPVGGAGVLARWAAASVRAAPLEQYRIARRYARLRRLLGFANLAAAASAIGLLGWGWAIRTKLILDTDHGPVLAPFAELLVPAPYLLALAAAWLLHYDAEKALHDHSLDGVRSFWPRAGHFLYQLRRLAFVLPPVVLMAAHNSLSRFFPTVVNHWSAQLATVALAPLLFVLLPLAVRPLLGLKPLPPGPVADRLDELARKLHFRHAGLLLWPTRGEVANAMVVGVAPWARYVVLSDRLIESLAADEVDAVFGHEVGHVKHAHLPYYALFLTLSLMAAALGVTAAVRHAAGWADADLSWLDDWLLLPQLAVLGAYLFVVFGVLSRTCERQADLYGCRVAGTGAMVRALRRVAEINGLEHGTPGGRWHTFRGLLRAWQHGTIAGRMAYLLETADDPAAVRRFQWRAFGLKCGLLLLLVGGLAALGRAVGWEGVLQLL